MAKYDVQITEGALGDLDAIRSFIAAQRGEESAEEWMNCFEEVIDSLERLPERGAVPQPLIAAIQDRVRSVWQTSLCHLGCPHEARLPIAASGAVVTRMIAVATAERPSARSEAYVAKGSNLGD